MRIFNILITVLILSLFSCSIDYEQGQLSDKDQEVPDFIMKNVYEIEVFTDKGRFEVEADTAQYWRETKETEFTNIDFREKDSNGSIQTEGQANFLSLSENNNGWLYGDILISSEKEEAQIEAEELTWEDENRLLTSENNSPVTITKDDGTIIGGNGLSYDAARQLLEFSSQAYGTFVKEEEDE